VLSEGLFSDQPIRKALTLLLDHSPARVVRLERFFDGAGGGKRRCSCWTTVQRRAVVRLERFFDGAQKALMLLLDHSPARVVRLERFFDRAGGGKRRCSCWTTVQRGWSALSGSLTGPAADCGPP
jgi:hypothetical protein